MPPESPPLIIDVAGLRLDAPDVRRLGHPLVGGVVLFARNWGDAAQLTALCRDIKAVRRDLLICVDQEGGRVQRFCGAGFTRLPPMDALGALWRHAGDAAACHAAEDVGRVLGAELRACGVDLSFAPVLDLDWGRSPVMAGRALARHPGVVTTLARSLLRGMAAAGLAHCAKHFPGHGFARADSHLAPAEDDRALEDILAADAAPYAGLGAQLQAVMAAHVRYPAVDARPAGFSRRWLRGILRERLGFGEAIFSDDLGMEAARWLDGQRVDAVQAALAALDAGCTRVMLCNQCLADGGSALDAWLDGMQEAVQPGRWRPENSCAPALPASVPQPDSDGEDGGDGGEALAQARANIRRHFGQLF